MSSTYLEKVHDGLVELDTRYVVVLGTVAMNVVFTAMTFLVVLGLASPEVSQSEMVTEAANLYPAAVILWFSVALVLLYKTMAYILDSGKADRSEEVA